MCIIVPKKDDIPAFKDYVAPEPAPVTADTPPVAAPPPPAPEAPVTAAPITPQAAPVTPAVTGGKVAASPMARRLAAEKGIDLKV